MKIEYTFIAPDIIRLRDGIKKLSALLESHPRVPATISDDGARLLSQFVDFQNRMGGGLAMFEIEIDKMLNEL